jgi:hypothetical protein
VVRFLRQHPILVAAICAILALQLESWLAQVPNKPVIADQVSPHGMIGDPWEELAQSQPLAFLENALDNYYKSVRCYTATFHKQELIGGQLGEPQVIEVRFREHPFSVGMTWTQNPASADRVLYVAGERTTKDGRELALVRPAGVISLLVPRVTRDIHGPDSAKVSRRTIDEFGFANTLRLILKYSRLADSRGELALQYKGNSRIGGRGTYLFERHLPCDRDNSIYPDRVLLYHIDKEWLLPTACYSFADDDREILLGSYVLTNVSLNRDLADADFTPEAVGL